MKLNRLRKNLSVNESDNKTQDTYSVRDIFKHKNDKSN